MGAYEVSLGDTIGVGTARQDAARCSQRRCASVSRSARLAGHFHDTYGQALTNVYAALEIGVATFDCSVAGLGGCPYAKGATGNVASEDVVYLLHGLGIETGVDLDEAARARARYISDVPRAAARVARRARAATRRIRWLHERCASSDATLDGHVPSPCISVCMMDAGERACVGCFRTLDEIAAWGMLDDDAKRARAGAIAAGARAKAPSSRDSDDRCDWYFDFVSPFAYLQSEQLASLAPAHLDPLPAGAVRRASRARTARRARPKSPAKRAFTYRFVRLAGAKARHPAASSRPSIRSIRCRCCALRSPATARPTPCIGSSASSGATGACPTCRSNGPSSRTTSACRTPRRGSPTAEVKDELRRNTDEAIARGVFGVPTLAIGDELFWGADATEMARDYVAAGCRFDDPEYARVAALPAGVTRKAAAPPPKKKTRVVGTAS